MTRFTSAQCQHMRSNWLKRRKASATGSPRRGTGHQYFFSGGGGSTLAGSS
ncbi:MAG: hypothetical protein WDM81_13055 [Rhizomicrobium sp.]